MILADIYLTAPDYFSSQADPRDATIIFPGDLDYISGGSNLDDDIRSEVAEFGGR